MLTRLYLKYLTSVPPEDPNKDPALVEENGPYVYDPERPTQRDMVLEDTAIQLQAIHLDRELQLKKWKYFVCCAVFSSLAVTLTLWGMSLTVIFDSYQKNMMIVWISLPFYIPFFIWLKVLLLPDTKEYNFRQYIMEKRFWRKKVAETHFKVYMGYDEEEGEGKNNGESSSDILTRSRAYQEQQAQLALRMKIGKNVPKLGQLDKSVYKPTHTPSRGLNIVLNREGVDLTRPPPILPTMILDTGTAHMLPDYQKNRYDLYEFKHPDIEGEEYGFNKKKLAMVLAEEKRIQREKDTAAATAGLDRRAIRPASANRSSQNNSSSKKKSKSKKKGDDTKSVSFHLV